MTYRIDENGFGSFDDLSDLGESIDPDNAGEVFDSQTRNLLADVTEGTMSVEEDRAFTAGRAYLVSLLERGRMM